MLPMATFVNDTFIYLVVCLTTGPKPLPKQALHIVRSRTSSFEWQYPLLSSRSSSSFLRLLPRLPVYTIKITQQIAQLGIPPISTRAMQSRITDMTPRRKTFGCPPLHSVYDTSVWALCKQPDALYFDLDGKMKLTLAT